MWDEQIVGVKKKFDDAFFTTEISTFLRLDSRMIYLNTYTRHNMLYIQIRHIRVRRNIKKKTFNEARRDLIKPIKESKTNFT